MKPKTDEIVGGLQLTWDCGLSANVVNYEHRREEAELKMLFTNGVASKPMLIGWQKLHYLSHSSQVDLERLLKKNLPKEVAESLNVGNAVLHLINTLEYFRKGEIAIESDTEQNLRLLDYLLYPVIPKNKQTIIFGDGSAGKSTLAILFAVLVGLPMTNNELGLTPPGKTQRGLLLDWETDPDDFNRTLKRMSNWLGVSLTGLMHYRRCARPIADDYTIINNMCEEKKIDYLIIDSLAGACGGDLMKPEPATQFNEVVRRFNKTLLVIAHNPKSEDNKTVFGSAIFTHRARAVWRCEGFEDGDNLDITMRRTKFNLGPKVYTLRFRATFSEEQIAWSKGDEESDRRVVDRIITVLRENDSTHYIKIADRLCMSEGNTRSRLSKLAKEGRIESLGGGNYGLL